jgi:hypothetical protein
VQRVTTRQLTRKESRLFAEQSSVPNTTWPLSPHRLLVTHNPLHDWVANRIQSRGYWEIMSPQDIAINYPAGALGLQLALCIKTYGI